MYEYNSITSTSARREHKKEKRTETPKPHTAHLWTLDSGRQLRQILYVRQREIPVYTVETETLYEYSHRLVYQTKTTSARCTRCTRYTWYIILSSILVYSSTCITRTLVVYPQSYILHNIAILSRDVDVLMRHYTVYYSTLAQHQHQTYTEYRAILILIL